MVERGGRGSVAEPTHAELVGRLFDAKAPAWPAKYAPDGPLTGRLASLGVAVASRVPAGGRVLDLGCGTGELVRWLAGAGRRVVGCDISAEMLRGASAVSSVGAVGWLRLDPDWQRLPFADGRFDVVVAASVLEYTADPGAVLAECARVLRPGGLVVCTVPDSRHPVRWLERLARAVPGQLAGLSAGAGRASRWVRYRRYLRASRQRHRLGWWLATAGQAGLQPASEQRQRPRRHLGIELRSLRMLSLQTVAEQR